MVKIVEFNLAFTSIGEEKLTTSEGNGELNKQENKENENCEAIKIIESLGEREKTEENGAVIEMCRVGESSRVLKELNQNSVVSEGELSEKKNNGRMWSRTTYTKSKKG